MPTSNKDLKKNSPYSGALTREHFMFYETRTTAKLMSECLEQKTIINKIVEENLFQYPTEKTIKSAAKACVERLNSLDNSELVNAIATRPSSEAKQICLYAMMRQYRLMWDFMITVIGDKYQKFDSTFSRMDIEVFFMRLREQDDWVASWSAQTINKIRQVITSILVENEYLDDRNSKQLNPVLISPLLENAIRDQGMQIALPAFNCLN